MLISIIIANVVKEKGRTKAQTRFFFFHDNSNAYLYIYCLGNVLFGENSVLIQAFNQNVRMMLMQAFLKIFIEVL